MRRINVHIDEELDRRAEREAKRRHMSKAALIRQSLRAHLPPSEPGRPDPLDELVGASEAAPVEDIDEVIYGA